VKAPDHASRAASGRTRGDRDRALPPGIGVGHLFQRVRVQMSAPSDWPRHPHAGAAPDRELMARAPAQLPASGGDPLRPDILAREQSRLGVDLTAVRLHQDAWARDAAAAFHARAFAYGQHIFGGRGIPDLQSDAGRDVLAHELTHVAQGLVDPALAAVVLRLPEADVVTALEARLTANDKPGFFRVLRNEAAAHASSTVVRGALSTFFTAARITTPEVWRAVSLQLFGTEANWPIPIKNFVEGIEGGQYTPPGGMPPATNDGLWEAAIRTAHTAAEGNTGFELYRGLFNSLWLSAPYRSLSAEFNNTLSSKGPRSDRARAIFNRLYTTNATIRASYDANPGGIRAQIDQYFGPDATNPTASPRLQVLRGVFRSQTTPIAATTLTDATYVAFKTRANTAAQNLDSNDRQVFESSHQWRLVVESAVTDPTLRSDLAQTIRTAWTTAPVPSSSGSAGGGSGSSSSPMTRPLRLTADQRTFVQNLSLAGPASPRLSQQTQETLSLTPQSNRDPAGLSISSRVEVNPSGLVRLGAVTENAWPVASPTGAVHSATVQVEGGTAGATDFTASLTLVPASGRITHTPRTAVVRVVDQRRAWFVSNIRHGLIFTDQNRRFLWAPGTTMAYYGGQQALSIDPNLPSPNRNLPVFVDADIKKNGTLLRSLPRVEFGLTAERRNLGGVTVLETSPPPTAPDHMELIERFFPSSASGATAFHTITRGFDIQPGTTFTNTSVLAQLRADHTALNSTGTGSFLARMMARGGQAQRIAQAIQAGTILLEPFLIRADSAAYIRAHPALGTPSAKVAYLMGHPAAADDAHTLVAAPGADAWRWANFSRSVFINLTPSLAAPAVKRNTNTVIDLVVHESVHVVDVRQNPTAEIERYKAEFRAYWMDGSFDRRPSTGGAPGPLRSTAFDPAMDNRGPKSEKARAIFNHLYGSPTYPFVRPEYDANVNRFREQVDAFVIPDGINLIVSARLENLRARIENYSGSGFAAHRTGVRSLHAATTAEDRREIVGNRSWRDLVERKYPVAAEKTAIKGDLGIPV
jgi:hypothetical protein